MAGVGLQPGGEEGAVLVTVAVWLVVLILITAFVIDIGNWFEHDRHLQLQADAAALAAAADFSFACDDDAVEETARHYSGELDQGYNQQVGGTSPDDVHLLLNSRTYYNQPDEVDDTVVEAPPCESAMVDVKLTETDLPVFFRVAGLFGSVPFINAHARVQLFELERRSPGLPVAVPDVDPRKVEVSFIDEANGGVLGTRRLSRNGVANGLAIWDNGSDPLPVTVNRERIGVRVTVAAGSTTACGGPLVVCYDAGSADGLLHVRGYSGAGTGAQPDPPLARSVTLKPGTCPDPYFVEELSSCTIGVRAQVDFGPCDPLISLGPNVTARVGNSSYPLNLIGCPLGSSLSTWETNGSPISIAPGAGPVEVRLDWEETGGQLGDIKCTRLAKNECKGTFGLVQRTFGASDDRSGPIRTAQVWENGTAWANSLQRCSGANPSCTYDLVVKIGLDPSIQDVSLSPEDPPIALRVFHEGDDDNPSQNQALDCDPDQPNLRDELAYGCVPEYMRNQGTSCPQTASALWDTPQPWDCVAVQTGGAVNQVFTGMNQRIHGSSGQSSCVSPSHWADFPAIEHDDPRIVPVFIAPFGAFDDSGNETLPVLNFAVFYATGWAGQGNGNRSTSICPSDDPAEAGTIVGHFIKYVQTVNDGAAGEEVCDLSDPTTCIAVMTE